MGGIVCALRGGLDSRTTITGAMKLAREASLPVRFLYVVNRELVSCTNGHNSHAVAEKLRQIGSSVVLLAQAIANSHGVAAQGAVRYGQVEEEIADLCHELDADYLILHRPRDKKEKNQFTSIQFARLGSRIEEDTGTKVIYAEGDGI